MSLAFSASIVAFADTSSNLQAQRHANAAEDDGAKIGGNRQSCLLYTSPSPRDS